MPVRGRTDDRLTKVGQAMQRAVKELAKKPHAKIGFPAVAFAIRHEGRDALAVEILSGKKLGSIFGKSLTVGEIAIVHEFGTADGKIPERSFIRAPYDRNVKQWFDTQQRFKGKVLKGEMSVRRALGLMAIRIQRDFQDAIRRGGYPFIQNAPSTIERKGSSSPLIDTAQMLNSVTYVLINAN